MILDYVALFLVCFVAIFIFYAIIAIHDIPYEIAVHRNHPHQDAIHAAGWVSLFTLHAIWPFLWIWATLYREDRGWGFAHGSSEAIEEEQEEKPIAIMAQQIAVLTTKVEALQSELAQLDSKSEG